ncbi:MAG: hypothetical protein DWQ04_11280 [Chloroflexi bacterium]|nr:MAG: hypothetical protein DWQ04_11280 [Chloroflexota bacterium]
MSKRVNISIILAILLLLGTSIAFAQQKRGEIHGKVHEDVNGDGLCIDTGVAGEDPISHIELEFVSSDEAVVINLITGDDGTYGLVAAGQSNWRVTANPDSTKWVVTSEKTRYAAVFEETLVVTDINFCVQKVGTVTTAGGTTTGGSSNAVIILPESGAAKDTTPLWLFAGTILGLSLIGIGIFFELRRRII